MAGAIKGFFRRDGHVIPIRESDGKNSRSHTSVHHTDATQGPSKFSKVRAQAKKVTSYAHDTKEDFKSRTNDQFKKAGIKTRLPVEPPIVNKNMDRLGLGLSVASGAIAAGTLSGFGAKGFVAGQTAAHVLDAFGIGANISSVAGRGRKTERTKQAAKQEARNFIIGNTVYALGALGLKKNRQAAAGVARSAVQIVKRVVFKL